MSNPFPYFREAADSAKRIAALTRDIAVLDAERQAKRQVTRLALGVGSLIAATVAVMLTLFWLSWQLYQLGVAAWALSLGSLIIFGGAAALLARAALKYRLADDKTDPADQDGKTGLGDGNGTGHEPPISLTRRTREELIAREGSIR